MKRGVVTPCAVIQLIGMLMAPLFLFSQQECCDFPYLYRSDSATVLSVPTVLQDDVLGLYDATDSLIMEWDAVGETDLVVGSLAPSKNYTLEAVSDGGGPSTEFALISPSLSSGDYRIYFNHAGFTEIAPGSLPNGTSGLELRDAVIEFIDNALFTIDIAMYNNNRAEIVEALKRAVDRGVRVRYITDDERANVALDNDINFPVWKDQGEGLMHNKFLVIDVAEHDMAWVIGGATNFTTGQIATDPNNLIAFQDKSLAGIYTIEFEEMWGGSGDTPDPSASRFGEDKTDNTPHFLFVGDIPMEVRFSPSDRTEAAIAGALSTADHTTYVALLIFTSNPLGDALIELFQRGVELTVLIEDALQGGSEYFYLQDEGVDVHNYENSGILHHKYAIVDFDQMDSDPLVINGSHNWTWSAENINDENTMIIHDHEIAGIYAQDFWGLACDQDVFTCVTSTAAPDALSHPGLMQNPIRDRIRFALEKPATNLRLTISDSNGRIVRAISASQVDSGTFEINFGQMPAGLYFLSWRDDSASRIFKLMKI